MKNIAERVEEGQTVQKAIINYSKSYYKRIGTLKKRLQSLLEGKHVYFITYTIKDIENAKIGQIQKSIKKSLNENAVIEYLYNEDYGTENGRLHYHCIASFKDRIDYKKIMLYYDQGAVNFKEIIAKNNENIKRYLTKQTLHATKQNTGKITYSKRRKENEKQKS